MPVVAHRPPQVFDVRDFGAWAEGSSAGVVAANTTTLQLAIDTVTSRYGSGYSTNNLLYNGGKIFIPRGTYRISGIEIDRNYVTLMGDSMGGTILETASADLITLGPSGNFRCTFTTIRDIHLRSVSGGGHVLNCPTSISFLRVSRCTLTQQNTAKAVYYHNRDVTTDADTGAAVASWDFLDNVFEHCNVTFSNSATVAAFHIRSNAPNASRWTDCRVNGAGYYVWDIEATSGYSNGIVIERITGEYNNGGLIRMAGARNWTVRDVEMYDLNTVSSGAISRDLISIEAASSGNKSGNCVFINVARLEGTLNAGKYDIKVVTNTATAFFTFINCGYVSAANFSVDLNSVRALSIESPYVTWTNASNLVKVHSESGIEGIASPLGVFSKGYQATRTARTATADGTGTGTIADNTREVTVTSANANNIIVLPTPTPGVRVTLMNGATGYELRSSSPTTVAINGGTGADAESAIPANTRVECYCASATAWLCSDTDTAGTVTATQVAAP